MKDDVSTDRGRTAHQLVFSRVFAASPSIVFQAWTDPEQLVHWWGPKGFALTVNAMDVRVGGVWDYILHGPDGTDYPNRAVFEEIVPCERLVMLNTGGHVADNHLTCRMVATFEEVNDGCLVTLRMQFRTPASLAAAKARNAETGGRESFARLEELLGRNSGSGKRAR